MSSCTEILVAAHAQIKNKPYFSVVCGEIKLSSIYSLVDEVLVVLRGGEGRFSPNVRFFLRLRREVGKVVFYGYARPHNAFLPTRRQYTDAQELASL